MEHSLLSTTANSKPIRPLIISPWIGPKMHSAYPNKREGRLLAAGLRRDLAMYDAFVEEQRATWRYETSVELLWSGNAVKFSEDNLANAAERMTRPMLVAKLECIREMSWDPEHPWVTPSVIRDFWGSVRAIGKWCGRSETVVNDGRQVLVGIFDRGIHKYFANRRPAKTS